MAVFKQVFTFRDQKDDREQHICFLPGFTPVDRKGRSDAHFPLRQTWRFQLPYHKLSVPEQQHSIFTSLWRFYLTAHMVCQGLLFLWMFYKGGTTFIYVPRTRICQGTTFDVWFCDMVIYSDTLNWSDITPIFLTIHRTGLYYQFWLITKFREVSIEHCNGCG